MGTLDGLSELASKHYELKNGYYNSKSHITNICDPFV